MRSYWPLLILLAACSHLAQKSWAALFENEMLRALLQLAGSGELRQVRAAESAKPYEMLSALSSDLNSELEKRTAEGPDGGPLSRNERMLRRLELVDEHVNIYDQTLEYYPNQLTYLLLTKNTASYRLSCLKLRRKLILMAFVSSFFSLAQFLLPLVFLGNEYSLYGWRYLRATLNYLAKQLTGSKEAGLDNSIDYELSSHLFPINAQCKVRQNGMTGALEEINTQCTIAINEICAKLFAVIWWMVVVSGILELWSLLMVVLCSLSFKTISYTFSLRFWPRVRQQADLIATFRHQRSVLMDRVRLMRRLRRLGGAHEPARQVAGAKKQERTAPAPPTGFLDEQIRAKKKLESGWFGQEDGTDSSARSLGKMLCLKDARAALKGGVDLLVCCQADKRRRHLEVEAEKDINVYYLLYLVYLRLGNSKSRVEEVIRMTACALRNYLAELEALCEEFKRADLTSEDQDEDADDYNSLDRVDYVIKAC